jgi:hypothetical protein
VFIGYRSAIEQLKADILHEVDTVNSHGKLLNRFNKHRNFSVRDSQNNAVSFSDNDLSRFITLLISNSSGRVASKLHSRRLFTKQKGLFKFTHGKIISSDMQSKSSFILISIR